MTDARPAECRDRLREEGKAYPKSGCTACGSNLRTGIKCLWPQNIADFLVKEEYPTKEDLWETLCYLGKWIERGIFDKHISEKESLEVMAHYPGMPWNSKRWNVDHKPYAKAYYERFPKTK